MSTSPNAPALLTMPHYAGTLAAVRCLGERGVNITVAADRTLAPGSWSRHVGRRVSCPSTNQGPRAILRWLLEFGRKQPGAVLYPSSDDMAWVVSRYAEELRHHYRLFAPPAETVLGLLDKCRLYGTCARLSVPTPRTWFPRSESELSDIYAEGIPLLLKPRSQMFFPAGGKGESLKSRDHARLVWREHRKAQYAPTIREEISDLDLPLLQEYEPGAARGTYSISGFADSSGTILVARAATKVLQNPPQIGVGVCFVASDVDPVALDHIQQLCRATGFFGAFEVEFVRRNDTWLLIDFNPRYFGQMAFDIARGAPLPWLVYCAALGRTEALKSFPCEQAATNGPKLYRDRVALTWRVGTGLLSGSMSKREAAEWRELSDDKRVPSMDATWSQDDPLPALVAAAATGWFSLRHPRSFVRSLLRSSDTGVLGAACI